LLLKQLPMKQKVLEAVSKTSIRILVKARRTCDNNIKSVSRKRVDLRPTQRGNWRDGASFTGDPGGCVKVGSGDGPLFR